MLNFDIANMFPPKKEYSNQNGHFYKSTTLNADEKYGYRKATPMLVPVPDIRPILSLNCRFNNGGSAEANVLTLEKPIQNIVKIWLNWVSISGIVGTHDNLCIYFEDSLHNSIDIGGSVINLGFNIHSRNMIPIPCLGVSDLLHKEATQKLVCTFRQQKNIHGMTLRITNSSGVPVAYDECLISLSLDVESFQ